MLRFWLRLQPKAAAEADGMISEGMIVLPEAPCGSQTACQEELCLGACKDEAQCSDNCRLVA